MKLRIKSILSTVLCFSMLLGTMGNISYAMDMTDNNKDVVGMETEADTGFNYTYVEKPYLKTPDTQNIVVSWGDGTEEISNVQILVSNEDGITEEWACVQNTDNLYLFSKEYADDTERTTYRVTDFRFIQDGEQHEISMLDFNAEVEFGVNKEYEEYGKYVTPLNTEDVEMTVVTIDENGQTKAQEDIQTALEEVTAKNMRMAKRRNAEVVVALDPGHDNRHGGAAPNNGLVEQNLTLKIANYAKEELETYQGVRVYMTRTTNACPYPETTSSGKCIEQRVLAAAQAGANIYVSIHLNTAPSSDANGAEIIYPNSSWKPQISEDGKALAQSILDELVKLGLKKRSIYSKDSTDGEKYEDGSDADYFAVQKYGKKQGIPGIIVEHAFMTNASDVNNFLRSEEGLERLGVADATGIANTYGLTKIPAVISAIAASQEEQEYLLKAENVSAGFRSVSFAVWSAANGQDDIIWYNGVKDSNGAWNAAAAISNHRTAGTYCVHVYGVTTSGVQKLIGNTEFEVSPVSIGTFEVQNYNQNAGSFDVIIDGISSASGVSSVRVPVWSTSNQSDIRWYEAERQSDGSYIAHVKISNHGYHTGRYSVHLYVYAKNGLTSARAISQDVKEPNVTITSEDANGTEERYSLKAENAGMAGDFRSVSFAVWSVANGQDDIIWYNGVKDSNGAWNAVASISNHRTAGTYYVHVYGVTSAGVQKFIGSTEFEVSPVSVGTLRTDNYHQDAGSFDVVIDDISSTSGVSSVRVPVWSTSNKSDIRWYEAEKQNDGSYIAHVKISNHGYHTGRYFIHLYLYAKNGLLNVSGTSQEVQEPKVTITAKDANGTEEKYSLKTENAGMAGNFRSVSFAVWSAANGQDDIIWYNGVKDSNGAWNAVAAISNHRTAGTYYVHVYGVTTAGVQKLIGSTEFEVSPVSVGTFEIQNYNQNAGSFDVVIDDIRSVSGVSSVRVPVWSTSNQSDIRWYEAERQSDGSYIAHVKISNHGYHTGRYSVHLYVYAKNGLMSVSATSQDVKEPKVTITAKDANGTEEKYSLKAENAGMAGDFRSVNFAVWSVANGQDDIIWYHGVKDSNGDWNAVVAISNHRTAGTYYVHVYAVTTTGVQKFIGSTEFNIAAAKINSSTIENYQEDIGTYDIILDIAAPSGIAKIQVPVWSEANHGDIRWYDAEKQSSDKYIVHVDPIHHNYNTGIYHAHVYITAGNGIMTAIAIQDQEVQIAKYYSIMGRTTTTVDQMVRYFENSKAIYPAEALAKGGAKDIQTFCQIYYEEAMAEGVRAEVAFAQSMNETGFLKFGGIVQVEQFNFAGIGALDGNTSGQCASFPDVRTGVRAQIQHLKAYASKENLNNACIDPRFSLVTRGCAPYVQWLGIHENPYGKGWASAENYGYNLVEKYIRVLKQQ